MSLVLPPVLQDTLASYEIQLSPIAEIELQAALRRAMSKSNPLSPEERRGAWAEVAAFHFVPAETPSRTPWGTYFGPIKTGTTPEGETVYSPNAGDIDSDIIEYWEGRASTTSHPLLRARYADLVWEFGKAARATNIRTGFAWVAADAYLMTVEKRLVEHEAQAWRFIDRALEIALSLSDAGRVRRAKAALFDFLRAQQDAGRLTMWWKPDEISFGHAALELGAAEVQEVLLSLEAALARYSDPRRPDQFDPQQTLAAADRLIRHRKRLEQPRQAVRVMKAAGAAVEAAAIQASPLQAIGWIEDVLRRYRDLSMHEDAERAQRQLDLFRREPDTGPAASPAHPSMGPVASTTWLDRLTAGTLTDALHRFAPTFLVKEDLNLRASDIDGSDSAGNAIISGRAIHTALAKLTQKSSLLSASLEHVAKRHTLDLPALMTYLGQSRYFDPGRRRFLEAGLGGWFAGDSLKTIFVLVPEIEGALRNVMASMNEPVTRPLGDGGAEPLNIADLVTSRAFCAQIDRNVRLHMAALYYDTSGLNLQNKIARGMASFEQLGPEVANWVVHSLLLVCTITPGSPVEIPLDTP